MLSRRDRLLVQPWEERRFKDHRSKVLSATAAVDVRAPAPRPHVALKLKQWQRECERSARVARDNRALLQRLGALMRRRRLDNHWPAPPPNFQRKVGQFFSEHELAARVAARVRPAPALPPLAAAKCYACETKKMQFEARHQPVRGDTLPSIH